MSTSGRRMRTLLAATGAVVVPSRRDLRQVKELYRYRGLSGEKLYWIRDAILKGELYFSSPADLNDPFDCRVEIDPNPDRKAQRDVIGKALRELAKARDRPRMIRDIVTSGKLADPDVVAAFEQSLQNAVARLGIACFSMRRDSLLMWSHYGESHRGICLKYAFEGDRETHVKPVNYSDESPVRRLGDDSQAAMEAILLTKATCWEYEQEHRLISMDAPGVRVLQPNAVVGVVLGCRIDPGARSTILRWVRKARRSIEVVQARQARARFALDFELMGSVG